MAAVLFVELPSANNDAAVDRHPRRRFCLRGIIRRADGPRFANLAGDPSKTHICSCSACWSSNAMPSPNYILFEKAMRTRKQIVCTYGGYVREICPIILGHSQGEEKALTFQFGGQSKSGLPPGGEWRCLWLSKVNDVELRDGPWVSGASHRQPQGCVEVVDLDVNSASPYRPARRLR